MFELNNRCVIVTGAAQGIGAAYALALAKQGAKVVVSDIASPDGAVEAIEKAGGQAIGVVADVSDFDACASMADAALHWAGKIDVLVNNAAMFASIARKPFDQLQADEWDAVMNVNVRGPFNTAKAVFPSMKTRGHGKIINVSSATVFSGTPGMLHYVTSKGAIIGFTRSLAREIGQFGITVNGIAPGLTMSEGLLAQRDVIAPFSQVAMASRALKREQVPSDLVGTLVFLASPGSDFLTGQTIVVDGGYVMN